MYFCVNEFKVGVNDSIFSGNEQQKGSSIQYVVESISTVSWLRCRNTYTVFGCINVNKTDQSC